MPLKWYECPICGEHKRSTKGAPECDHVEAHEEFQYLPDSCQMEELLVAPKTKFMEKTDEFHGKSQMRDQQKILKKRAREYSRDNEMHELIANNPKDEAVKNGWVNSSGVKRKAIDDL